MRQITQINTTGDLRGFLGDVLIGIRDGKIDKEQAAAIAKVASQMNLSISVEVNAAIQLERLGKGHPAAGTMLLIGGAAPPQLPPSDEDGLIWCDQCDMRVNPEDMSACKSKHCQKLQTAQSRA